MLYYIERAGSHWALEQPPLALAEPNALADDDNDDDNESLDGFLMFHQRCMHPQVSKHVKRPPLPPGKDIRGRESAGHVLSFPAMVKNWISRSYTLQEDPAGQTVNNLSHPSHPSHLISHNPSI
ncbi:hypothetical protein GJ744_003836 [Endocarpon pusillum]|uniref:Uncharacterized protein n=1 Tax=Endocarpon pusillum TaxID=364733 RepID=A0A8H7AM50_9EURO|nr:hypothetical protein GJ744_003836 [Endocarpon pusillum]